ncbi:hypothetical protein PC116_g31492 [Phytophthora cactorum]|nr:hypothetical protein PC116_g31492 [Phytophthora cactorum]
MHSRHAPVSDTCKRSGWLGWIVGANIADGVA